MEVELYVNGDILGYERGYWGRAGQEVTKSRNEVQREACQLELFEGYVPGSHWVTVGYRFPLGPSVLRGAFGETGMEL